MGTSRLFFPGNLRPTGFLGLEIKPLGFKRIKICSDARIHFSLAGTPAAAAGSHPRGEPGGPAAEPAAQTGSPALANPGGIPKTSQEWRLGRVPGHDKRRGDMLAPDIWDGGTSAVLPRREKRSSPTHARR